MAPPARRQLGEGGGEDDREAGVERSASVRSPITPSPPPSRGGPPRFLSCSPRGRSRGSALRCSPTGRSGSGAASRARERSRVQFFSAMSLAARPERPRDHERRGQHLRRAARPSADIPATMPRIVFAPARRAFPRESRVRVASSFATSSSSSARTSGARAAGRRAARGRERIESSSFLRPSGGTPEPIPARPALRVLRRRPRFENSREPGEPIGRRRRASFGENFSISDFSDFAARVGGASTRTASMSSRWTKNWATTRSSRESGRSTSNRRLPRDFSRVSSARL